MNGPFQFGDASRGLMQGHSANEKSGFAEHPALLRACRSGFPPVLFHKAALHESDDASLAADIRKEIGSSHRTCARHFGDARHCNFRAVFAYHPRTHDNLGPSFHSPAKRRLFARHLLSKHSAKRRQQQPERHYNYRSRSEQ